MLGSHWSLLNYFWVAYGAWINNRNYIEAESDDFLNSKKNINTGYSKYIQKVSTKLDKFTRNLNDTFYTKMMKIRNSAVA